MVLPYAKTEPLYNLLKYHRPCFMILFVCFHNSVLSFLFSYILFMRETKVDDKVKRFPLGGKWATMPAAISWYLIFLFFQGVVSVSAMTCATNVIGIAPGSATLTGLPLNAGQNWSADGSAMSQNRSPWVFLLRLLVLPEKDFLIPDCLTSLVASVQVIFFFEKIKFLKNK